MKKKLIKRNKQKYSKLMRKYGHLFRIFHRLSDDDYIRKFKHRYNEVEDFENAFRIFDDWISVPICISSRNKKSREQKRVHSYLVVTGIEEFNKKYGTNLELSDIPEG